MLNNTTNNLKEITNEEFIVKELLNDFYDWLSLNILNDLNTVIDKDFRFFINPYKSLYNDSIEIKYEVYNNSYNINKDNLDKLEKYLNHTKRKYKLISEISYENINMGYFNRMLSWYDITYESIENLINILSE
jgi:hypothetical protein